MVVRHDEPQKKIALEYALIVAGLGLLIAIVAPSTNSEKFGQTAYQNVANAIGVFAAIAPNEANTLAQQFEKKDGELTLRERDLALREQQLGEQYKTAIAENNRTTLAVVGGVTFFLFLLILLNFYLDVFRKKKEEEGANVHAGELRTRL